MDLGRPRVGLVYDERMCLHATPDGERHPENPERIRAIWRKLESSGITKRCVVLKAKEAEDEHIASVHTKHHIKLIRHISSKEFDSRRNKIASQFNSIYFNKGSSEAAYLAAGSVIEVSERVARGDLNSAIAIVRPPGHHAEPNEAMGFCLFNNIAITAKFLLNEKPELGIKKILIVDWDVHHGNGTQNVFYKDPRLLFFSVHRFDFGSFYPGGDAGAHFMTGEDQGAGYNINVPWEHGQCGDADYIAVWDHVLLPVAEAYNPDIVLVSAGFDAAIGDPLGGCCITPFGYSTMLKKLMRFARGKIVLVLEGGYNLNSIANSVLACAETLLEEKTLVGSSDGRPFKSTWRVIEEVRQELKMYWPILSPEIPPQLLISNSRPYLVEATSQYSSDSDVENDADTSNSMRTVNSIEIADDIIPSLSKLNVNDDKYAKTGTSNDLATENSLLDSSEASSAGTSTSLPDEIVNSSILWRSVLSKIEVWYASYGSNMWKERFLCYIEGGKVDGMKKPCYGSRDKSLPKDTIWKIVPHKLFFARSHTNTWGAGGVAFLNPESNSDDRAYVCIYRITLEQFNDVLFQENSIHQENRPTEQMESPLLDLSQLDSLSENKTMILEVLEGGWYSNVLYLGKEDNVPILTMTCQSSHVEKFRKGDLPMCAPPNDYRNTLVKGLIEGKQLNMDEANDYLNHATITKL